MTSNEFVYLSPHQKEFLVTVAKAMAPFEKEIALRWFELYSANKLIHQTKKRTVRSFRYAVRLLLTSLSNGDVTRYLNRVQKAGVSFARLRERYENLIIFFRLYEESVEPILLKVFPNEIEEVRFTLEHLYHGIIALISRAYFMELEKDREKFVSTLVHDIRNPLIGMTGLAEQLMGKNMTREKETRFLRIIRDSGGRMSSLLDHALTYGRLKSGKALLRLNAVDVVEITKEAVMFLLPEVEKASCCISINGQQAKNWRYLPPVMVYADRELLLRALGNYLSNALKYAKAKVAVSIEEHKQDVLISVRDDGPGVPLDKQRLLFESYGVVPGGKPGIGIGLASVKMIADLHKGRAWVDGVCDKGSTFHLSVPKQPHEHEKGAHA